MLTEPEAKAAISAYGIPVPETIVAKSPAEVEKGAGRLLETYEHVVVKLLSKAISHKSDIGGVVLNIAAAAAAGEAARSIEARVRKHAPEADIEGYTVQPMVVRKQAQELILGMSLDPTFGPVVMFGAGGVAVEVMDDTAIALPPLDDVLASDLIGQTGSATCLQDSATASRPIGEQSLRRSTGCRRWSSTFPASFPWTSIRCSPMPKV